VKSNAGFKDCLFVVHYEGMHLRSRFPIYSGR